VEGYKLKKIESLADLKEAEYEWVLDQCAISLDEVSGCYVILGDTPRTFTPNREGILKLPVTTCVTVFTNVDNRMFWEIATAFKVGTDELWITTQEMLRVTT